MILGGGILALACQDAGAQTAARAIDAVVACRAQTDATVRLRCFDQAAAELAQMRESGELVALDHTKIVQARKERFGLPTTRRAATPDPLGALQQVDGAIGEVKPAGYDRFRVSIAGNGVWETIEHLSTPPSVGDRIRISRSNFGGFRATIGKGRSVLVKRIR